MALFFHYHKPSITGLATSVAWHPRTQAMPTTVAILGASENPARASNMACRLLVEHGHTTYAVSLHGRSIHGASGRTDLSEITEPLDTITVYISPRHQPTVLPALLAAHPPARHFQPRL